MNSFFSDLNSDILVTVFHILYAYLPLWFPIILLIIFHNIWMEYIITKGINKEGGVLLEMKLPKEITKSPLAMELVLISLWQKGSNSYLDTYIRGKTKPWFSLELVSIEGQVKFYIWTRPKYRRLLESQVYAQYPGVEIHESEDYTKTVFHPGKLKFSDPAPFWATYFKFTKPDVYPIKTYVDYGLDKDPKEEFKIDPITSVLEFLGSLKKGEQVWIQILIQGHKKEGIEDGRLHKKPFWKDAGEAEVKKLIEKLKVDGGDDETGARSRRPTKQEDEVINALERCMSKLPFEVAIRGFYIAKPEAFDGIGITGLIGSFKQYGSETLNGFKLGKCTDFDYPWHDWIGFGGIGRRIKRTDREVKMLDAYKRRSFFHTPYKNYLQKTMILNTEELATIFHFPGSVASTPTLQKSMSKKGEAPPNLPV